MKRLWSKRLIPLLVGGLLFVVTAGAAIALFGGDDASYTPESREAFLAACTADGGDDVESVCVCWYDSITQPMPYERYDEVSTEFLAQLEADPDSSLAKPDDFEALLADCRPAA